MLIFINQILLNKTMASAFKPEHRVQPYYVPWGDDIFYVRVHDINGWIICYIQIVAFIGDSTVTPERNVF